MTKELNKNQSYPSPEEKDENSLNAGMLHDFTALSTEDFLVLPRKNVEEDFFRMSYVALTGIAAGYEKLFQEEQTIRGKSRSILENYIKLDGDGLMQMTQELRTAPETRAAKAKLERTLQRLKDKGYYTENASELWLPDLKFEAGASPQEKSWSRVRNMICGIMECGAKVGFRVHKLTEDEWMSAIEVAVALRYPGDILDKDIVSYAIHLPELINDIRLLVVLLHITNEYERLLHAALRVQEKNAHFNELVVRYEELSSEYKKVVEEARDQRKLQQVTAEAEKQKHTYEKQIFSLQREVEKLKNEKEHLSELWAKEMDAVTKWKGIEDNPNEQTSFPQEATTITDEEKYGEVELPEKNVLFLGGWTKLVQSVKQRHPNWLFINSVEDRKVKGSHRIDVVFFFYGYISHKLAWRVYNELRTDVETIFISQKNESLMELEMKKGYAQLKEQQAQKAGKVED